MQSENFEIIAYEYLVNGLQTDWSNYLDDLELLAESDRILGHDKENLKQSFINAKEYCINKRHGESPSWEIFDLDNTLQLRLMHIVIRLQSLYPFKYESLSHPVVDNYEDDFEYDEEFEEECNNSKFSVVEEPLSLGHELEEMIDEDINNKVSSRSSSLKSYSDATFEMPSIQYSYYDEYDQESSTDSRKDFNNDVAVTAVSVKVSINAKTNDSNNKRTPGTTSSDSISPKKITPRSHQVTWIQNNEWRLGEKIGSGSFGEVFQCMNPTGKLYAVKHLSLIRPGINVQEIMKLQKEIQFMKDYQHKHIVGYIGAKVDVDKGLVFIFQEWVPGGSMVHLLKKFGPFQEGVVRSYTRQILEGLAFLHENGIIHRDIKGGNVLVDDEGTVKLADFGASTSVNMLGDTQETETIKGTPYFMAPEVLAHSKYGRKGDIWAVGCTVVQMFTGEPPWKDQSIKTLIQLHIFLSNWENGPPPMQCTISSEAKEFLNLCFQKDVANRPKAAELLRHVFLIEESATVDVGDLEDSGNSRTMNALKEDMYRAVSKSQNFSRNVDDDFRGSLQQPQQPNNRVYNSASEYEKDSESPKQKTISPKTPSSNHNPSPNPFARKSIAPSSAALNDGSNYVSTSSTIHNSLAPTAHNASRSVSPPLPPSPPSSDWTCLRCKTSNNLSDFACIQCATLKGKTGNKLEVNKF